MADNKKSNKPADDEKTSEFLEIGMGKRGIVDPETFFNAAADHFNLHDRPDYEELRTKYLEHEATRPKNSELEQIMIEEQLPPPSEEITIFPQGYLDHSDVLDFDWDFAGSPEDKRLREDPNFLGEWVRIKEEKAAQRDLDSIVLEKSKRDTNQLDSKLNQELALKLGAKTNYELDYELEKTSKNNNSKRNIIRVGKQMYSRPVLTTGAIHAVAISGIFAANYFGIYLNPLIDLSDLGFDTATTQTQLGLIPFQISIPSFLSLYVLNQTKGIINLALVTKSWTNALLFRYQAKQTDLEKLIELDPKRISYRLRLAEVHHKYQDSYGVLEQVYFATKIATEKKSEVTSFDMLATKMWFARRKLRRHTFLDIATKLLQLQLKEDYSGAIKVWQEIIAKRPTDYNLRIFYAQSLELMKKQKLADTQWKIAIDQIETEKLNSSDSVGGRNLVLRIGDNDYVRKTLLFKTHADPKNPNSKKEIQDLEAQLLEENNKTKIFREYLPPQVADCLDVRRFNDRLTLVLKIAGNESLYDLLAKRSQKSLVRAINENSSKPVFDLSNREHIYGHLEESVKLLAQIHNKGFNAEQDETFSLDDIVQKNLYYFTERIHNLFLNSFDNDPDFNISSETKNKITHAYFAVNNFLVTLPRDYYKDHNPKNILLGFFGNVMAIDFEGNKKLPCQLDLVSLLEFGSNYVSEKDKRTLLDIYVKTRSKEGQNMDEFFLMGYYASSIQRNLELFAYRSRDKLRAKYSHEKFALRFEQEYHLMQARDSCESLIQMYSQLGQSDEAKNVLLLRQQLSEIEIVKN
ncbi:hypothetical protein HN587_07980 [Candidatus Woesearchaeota archaeon]|jgi:hypothetical protein|nr:hypothetical protein [Candidatus Woesearchaeota archaeon]